MQSLLLRIIAVLILIGSACNLSGMPCFFLEAAVAAESADCCAHDTHDSSETNPSGPSAPQECSCAGCCLVSLPSPLQTLPGSSVSPAVYHCLDHDRLLTGRPRAIDYPPETV